MAELAFAYRVQRGQPGSLSENELRKLQLKRLNKTLSWAREHCAFHRSRLPQRPLDDLGELALLPLMDASAFQHGMAPLMGLRQDKVNRIVSVPTSGTTGEPKRIAFTREEHADIVRYLASGMRMLAQPGETVAVLFPCEHTGGLGQLIVEGIKQAQVKVCAYGLPTARHGLRDLIQTCLEKQVTGMVGFPHHIFALAVWSEHLGISLPIQNVLLSADNVAPSLKYRIAQILNAEVYAHYGTTEMGYGGAVECGCHCGHHIRETDLLFEVVNPKTGQVLPAGEWGELVFTTLNRKAMPLIRYRTGDRTRLLPGACECGSPLRRIDIVDGRIDDQLPFSRYDVEDEVFAWPGVLDFSLRWDATNLLLSITVQTVPDTKMDHPALSQMLSENLKVKVRINQVAAEGFLPLHPGKRFIVLEGKEFR